MNLHEIFYHGVFFLSSNILQKTRHLWVRKEHDMRKVEDIFVDYMNNNDVEDNAEVKQSSARLLSYFGGIAGADKSVIDDMLSYLGYQYERQGFINGFTYAVQIADTTQKVGVAV